MKKFHYLKSHAIIKKSKITIFKILIKNLDSIMNHSIGFNHKYNYLQINKGTNITL